MKSPRVAVVTDGKVACDTILWRLRGRLQLTVVVKASFACTPDDVAAHLGPSAVVWSDRLWEGGRSLVAASDWAPHRPRCDVTLVGHAWAPGGQPTTAAAVRLGVARAGQAILDKVIHVFGERGPGGAPEPFACMPIVYERAFGGPDLPNPVGTGAPNLIDPHDPHRPAAFGPIAADWPERARLSGGLEAHDASTIEYPETMNWEYFQAAPPDQQIEPLQGGEWLVLDGLHREHPRVQTRVPGARAVARLVVRSDAGSEARPVELRCDAVAVEADELRFDLTWRGSVEVAGGEAVLPTLLVAAALSEPPLAVDWARIAPETARVRSGAKEATVALKLEDQAASAARPAMPFPPAPPGPRSVPRTDATPWSARPPPPPPPPRSERTMMLRAAESAPPTEPCPVEVPLPSAPPLLVGAPPQRAPAPAPAPPESAATPAPEAPSPPPATKPPEAPARASRPRPKGPADLAASLLAAGASGADVEAFLQSLRPPPPPPKDE